MLIQSHLLLRPSGYYFRLVVPKHLRPYFGKTEIKLSLKTANRQVAINFGMKMYVFYTTEFDRLRMTNSYRQDDFRFAPWTIQKLDVKDGVITIQGAQAEAGEDTEAMNLYIQTVIEGSSKLEKINKQKDLVTRTPPKTVTRLSLIIQKFLEAKKLAKIDADQYNKYIATLNILTELIGDKGVDEVTNIDVELVRDTLLVLPKHRNNTSMYKNKNIKESIALANLHNKPRLDVSTTDQHLLKISGFFEFARKRNYLSGANPFQGKTTLTARERKKRSPRKQFDNSELKRIFSAENYAKIDQPSLFWLPLLAIFTGARLGELAQLHIDDIKNIQNIWCIDINNQEGKKLKTEAASRLVPLHTKLIDLGFLDYINDLREADRKQLFPTISRSSKGSYSYAPSKEFAAYMDNIVGIKEKGKDFHAFRHVSNNNFKQNGINIEMRCELVGHIHNNVNSEVYSDQFRVQLKKMQSIILNIMTLS
jgi:integrase